MPGFRLFTSNRLEALMERLAEIHRAPLPSPLEKEIVIVQSKGMERWICMEAARRQSVCANYSFPFPNAFIHEMFKKFLGDFPDPSPFDPASMAWQIMKVLPACLSMPEFESLRNYLRDDPDRLRLLQLAQRIADLFDQYLLFRPEMVLDWEKGEGGHWQSILWSLLPPEGRPHHRAALRKAFLEKTAGLSIPPSGLPQRIAIFGIAYLPPFHMEIFFELARFMDVNFFFTSPCREYWADIRSGREIERTAGRGPGFSGSPEELYLEEGNSLLASMGALGRDFFRLAQTLVMEEEELFQDPGEDSLLHCIQSDILDLKDRGPERRTLISEDDRSILIQSCHSPMREIEVLYDSLLDLFDREPDLHPRDVLVMTPDINLYAPFVHAVLDTPEDPALKIPFSITDRSVRKESQIIEGFLAILGLSGSRFSAPQVLGVLDSKGVRRKFGFSESDLDLINRWVSETRIRWGVDGNARAEMGFQGFPENSWRAGLDRLLLGYAMPGREERMFRSILPYDPIEGSDTAVLGRFLSFTDRLFAGIGGLARPRRLAEWAESLALLLDLFFDPDADSEKEAQTVRKMLQELAAQQDQSGFDEPVGLKMIQSWLTSRLDATSMGLGFITGGVTFCAMLPMRSIPFKVICLVGMDDGVFPRQSRSLGFDLMAKSPKAGDRSLRNEDRYLFLEAILSARRTLYISYTGQSAEDNSQLPPSVLVSELTDVIEKGYELPETPIMEHIAAAHRLQPFSPQYFKPGDARFFSYSKENCLACLDAGGERRGPRCFISSGIGEPEKEWRVIEIPQLCRFFANPARFLLAGRLQMEIDTRGSIPEDREAFDLDPLERYLLEQKVLERQTEDRDMGGMLPLLRASGRLPHGTVGECRCDTLVREASKFFAKIERFVREPEIGPLMVELDLPPFQLLGQITGISRLGLAHYRNARLKATDRLSLWVPHLALSLLEGPDISRTGFLIGTDAAIELMPAAHPDQALASLLDIYWEGLIRPIHFFPRSSYAYARALLSEGKPRNVALKKASSEWTGDGRRKGECDEPHIHLTFGETDPLDAEFERLAVEIFGPMLECERSVE